MSCDHMYTICDGVGQEEFLSHRGFFAAEGAVPQWRRERQNCRVKRDGSALGRSTGNRLRALESMVGQSTNTKLESAVPAALAASKQAMIPTYQECMLPFLEILAD